MPLKNSLVKILGLYKQKGRVFRRSLITLLVVTSLPTLAICISSYYIGVNQIETEVRHTHNDQFQRALKEIDKKLTQLELIILGESFSTVYSTELRNLDSQKHFESINNIYQSLLVMKNLSPSIKDASAYFSQTGICLSNEEGYTVLPEGREKSGYDSMLEQNNNIIWVYEPVGPDSAAGGSSVLLASKIPGYSTDPYGLIIASIDFEEVTDSIHSLAGSNEGMAFLIDKGGGFIISEEYKEGASENLYKAYSKEVAGGESDNDSFIYKWNGISYSVAYGTLDTTGCVLVTATPLNQLTDSVANMARLIIIVSILGFLAAILLSLIGSIRVLSPINKLFRYISGQAGETIPDDEVKYIENKWRQMVSEKHRLKESLESNYPVLRHGFFLQLILGYLSSIDEIALREQIKHYGWDVNGKSLLMLCASISKAAGLREEFGEEDGPLITFAASNIIEELIIKKHADAHVINLQNTMIGLMIFFDENIPVNQVKNDVHVLCGEMIKHLAEYAGIGTTICVGRLTKALAGVNKEFEEICKAISFRDIKKDPQIIDIESVLLKSEGSASFPYHIEKEIVQALKMGAGHEAARLIKIFYDEIKQNIGKEYLVKQSMIQLLGFIQYELLNTGADSRAIYEENLFEQLYRIKEPEEICKWFGCKVVEPYIRHFYQTRNIQVKRLVENVIKLIEENYQTDISLEWCADLNSTYPQRLSAAFKAVTGLNFIDYLNKYRIEKAKELLKYTDKDITAVAKSVGYQPSYFNRVFRKFEGITPGTFRENKRGCLDSDISVE